MKTREEAVALKKYPLSINTCRRCGHHQLGIVVDPTLMFSNYAYASWTSESFRNHFTEYAREIYRRYGRMNAAPYDNGPPSQYSPRRLSLPKFSVLEVGSNDGTMMKALFSAGATHVRGVEPAVNLAKQCTDEGLNVTCAFFDEQVATNPNLAGTDFWVANNVLAHVDDFVGTLKALALTGAKAGVFEVQYLGALLDGGMFDMVYHEHIDYWRATELVEHLHKHTQWFVHDVELVPTHGGSLRVWVTRRAEGAHPDYHMPDLEVVHAERKRNWPEACHAVSTKMEAERKQLWALLGDGKRVAIFGAPAKLTTLLYGLRITNLNFSYIVDDSPLKQGLYAPGTGLWVTKPEQLKLDPPDAVLVGAWNFAKHIVPRVADLCPGIPIVTPFDK